MAIIAAPPYICGSEEDIEQFYLEVADGVKLPIGIYNNPPRVKTDPPAHVSTSARVSCRNRAVLAA